MSSTPDPSHDDAVRDGEEAVTEEAAPPTEENASHETGTDADAEPDRVDDVEPEDSEPEGSEPEPQDVELEPEDVEPEPEPKDKAGEAPAETTEQPRGRLGFLLSSPGRSQALVGVLLALLGFAAVTQVRSTELDDSFEGRREEELIEIFNGLTGTSERTRREIARLEQDRRELQVDTSARTAAIEQAEQRLRTLNILAGLVPVTGPGVRITITEQEGRITIDSLLDLVQELRTAGAEAMEFNGEVRLVASSSFDDVNGVIHLDGVPLTSPYVLEVIGESHTLRTGVVFPSGPVANLREKEMADVAIEVLEVVDVEAVRELPRAEFAEPAEGQ